MTSTLRLFVLVLAWAALGRTVVQAQCTQVSTLNYTTSTNGDRRAATATVGGTTVTTSGYTTAVAGGNTNTFAVGTNASLPSKALVWQQNTRGATGATAGQPTDPATVTYTFSRPVTNLTLVLTDIDRNTATAKFIDQMTFDGYVNANDATPIALVAADVTSGTANALVAGTNSVAGTATSNATAAGNVTVTFPQPVTKLVLSYQNTYAYSAADDRTQTAGINSIAFCSQADVYARFTAGPATAVTGQNVAYTVQFGNNGPDIAATTVTRKVTLPTGAVVTSNGGGTVSGNTIDFGNVNSLASGASSSFSYAYNLPTTAGTYNNTATITAATSTTGYDPAANNTANRSVLVTSVAGACTTAPVDLDFRTRPNGESWKAKVLVGVPAATSVTKVSTTYSSANNGSTLAIGAINGPTLRWDVDYAGGNGGDPNSSTVTYTFSRPVSNFSVRVQDIDGNVSGVLGSIGRSGFVDQMEFSATNGGAAVVPVVTKVLAASTTVSVSGSIATGNTAAASSADDGAVIASFPSAITSLTLTYRNVITGNGFLGAATTYAGQAVGIDLMSWCRLAPVANNVTNATLPSAAGQVSISGLSSSVDGMVKTYTLVSVPTPAQGVLYYNSNGSTYLAAVAGQTLTDDQAASLRFDPALGASGNVTFSYSVQDDADLTSNNATYTIPVNNTACPVNTTTLSFAARPAAEDWKAHAALAVPTGSPLTTIRSSGYTSPASATLSTLMTADQNGVQSLQWFTDYATTTANSASVTFTFSRAVSNFAVRVQDIDAVQDNNNAFIDRVTFAGANGGTAVTPVLSPVNPDNGSVIITGTSATGTVNNTSPDDASVVAYFPNPITTLTLTYANTSTFATNPTQNAIGIDLMTWCQLAPVANAITASSMLSSAPATAIAPFVAVADGIIDTYTLASLPAANQGILYVNGVPATLNQMLNATQITQLSFAPNPTFAGPATFTYTARDLQGNVSNTALYTIPVVSLADVTTIVTGPATLNAGQPSGTYIASFTNNGPGIALGVTQKVTLPAGASPTAAQLLVITNAYPGTTYDMTTGELYFMGAATMLAVGATNSFSFAFTAPTAPGSSALTSNVITMSGQAPNTAPDASTLTLTTNGVANVSAVISDNGPIDAGATATFTATFSNAGPQTAANVLPTIQLPTGLQNLVVTPPAGYSFIYNQDSGVITIIQSGGSTINLPAAPAAGSSLTYTIAYTQPAAPVTATASVSTTTPEAGQTLNNAGSATSSPNTAFNVATTVSGTAAATSAGQVIYNVTTANNGASPAPNVVQTVTLPAGATNVFVTGGGTVSGNTVTFPTIASLAGGQKVTNTVSFTAPATATTATYSVGATATPTDAVPGDNSASASATVTAPPVSTTFANAFVTIATTTPAVAAGDAITVTATQGNNGRDAATGVITQVAIPVGLPITGFAALKIGLNGTAPAGPVSTLGSVATYAGGISYDSSTGLVTSATLATQPTGSGSYQTYALVFNAPISGIVTATADVSTTTIDNVMANNVASTQATVNPALTDVTAALIGPAAATAGELLTYTVTTTTKGPNPAANIVQTVAIPAGLPVAGANAVSIGGNNTPTVSTNGLGQTIATYGSGAAASTYNQATGLVTFATIAAQGAGVSASNTIAYYAPGNGNIGLTNVASATTTSPELVTTNNSDAVVTSLQPSADVQVAISGPSAITVGGTATYTVATTNNGPSVTTVAPTVQLPAGLNNVLVRGADGVQIAGAYNSSTGVVTLATVNNLAATASSISSITFEVPANTNLLQPTVTASTTTLDPTAGNNTATMATVVRPATATPVNLGISVNSSADYAGTTLNPTSLPAGSPVTFIVTARTNTAVAATNVAPTLQLPAGLPVTGANAVLVNNAAPVSVNATTGIATYADNSTYNPATGLVSFAIVNLAGNASVVNKVTVIAPGVTLVGTGVVSADQSEVTGATSVATRAQPIAVTPDVATSITGPANAPAGAPVTYTVVTSNLGLSPVAGVTQTVTLPAGVTTYSLNGGPQLTTTAGATITLTVPATLYPDPTSAVSNTITFNAPAAGFSFTGRATATGDAAAAGNNVSTQATTIINKAPVAANVVNSLQGPEGNTAGQLFISSLSATDPEGSTVTYTITKAPDAAQGRLYYNNGGTYTLVADNLSGLSATQATTLKFDPAAGFVGNATFSYTASDASLAVSNPALYMVPVGADNAALYTNTNTKGGNVNQYQNGDVLGYGIDPNGAVYNTAGLIYNPDGSPATGAGAVSNGIQFGKISVADSTTLAGLGVRYTSGTGLFTVANRTLLPRAGQTIPLSITTLDAFGGITVRAFSLVLGVNPLPVELRDFTAVAVKNVDAALVWTTASEKNNDHFEVERSLNGTDYVKIGQVQGQGSKTSPTDYALTDAGVGAKVSGVVYYRLKQVDTDGTASYSPVRAVAFATVLAPAIALYPNPATAATQLDLSQLPAGSYQVRVLDATGRTVLAATLDAGLAHALDLTGVASGTYTVLVRGQANGQVGGQPINLTKRLVKE